MRRSLRNGEMNETSTIRPASTISLETSATREYSPRESTSVKASDPGSGMMDVIAIEQIAVVRQGIPTLLDKVCDRRLAAPE